MSGTCLTLAFELESALKASPTPSTIGWCGTLQGLLLTRSLLGALCHPVSATCTCTASIKQFRKVLTNEHNGRHAPWLLKEFLTPIQASALQLIHCSRNQSWLLLVPRCSSTATVHPDQRTPRYWSKSEAKAAHVELIVTEAAVFNSPTLANSEVIVPKSINPVTLNVRPRCMVLICSTC